ncbi:MAG: hypothetical protein HYU97_12260 [Deltaproteobacteria bacterium]|nr:hypothetical protein [Deltaproteobacteria bacterium]
MIAYDEQAVAKLQKYWEAYIVKAKLKAAPRQIDEIISAINAKLREVDE